MRDTARITKFESLRGFGFAKVEARPDRPQAIDAFFHFNIWPSTTPPVIGQRIECDVDLHAERGPRITQIKVVEAEGNL
jgi:hypothetical protein